MSNDLAIAIRRFKFAAELPSSSGPVRAIAEGLELLAKHMRLQSPPSPPPAPPPSPSVIACPTCKGRGGFMSTARGKGGQMSTECLDCGGTGKVENAGEASDERQILPPPLEIDPDRMGGNPCVAGSRITVAQLISEAAEWDGVEELATDLGADAEEFRQALRAAAKYFSRPENFRQHQASADAATVAALRADLDRIHRAIGNRAPHDNLADCIIEWIEESKNPSPEPMI